MILLIVCDQRRNLLRAVQHHLQHIFLIGLRDVVLLIIYYEEKKLYILVAELTGIIFCSIFCIAQRNANLFYKLNET